MKFRYGKLLVALLVGYAFNNHVARVMSEEINSPALDRSVALVALGEVDRNEIDRVAAHIKWIIGVDCDLKTPTSILENTPEAEAKALEYLLSSNNVCMIALMNISQNVQFSGGSFPSNRVALLNIRALRPSDLGTEEGRERYLRRIEKQTLFMIGRLVGLDVCPFPLCAMREIASEEDLDQKPRDYCPPCKDHIIKILRPNWLAHESESTAVEGSP